MLSAGPLSPTWKNGHESADFIADTNGWLYESLSDSINNEFNEYGGVQEPTIRKSFDGSNIAESNLGFENRLFALLDDLCTLLYDYKKTRT